jgi:glycerol kinase
MAKTTYGTGAFALMNTGTAASPSSNGLLTTALFKMGEDGEMFYALEGSVGSCAIGINWFVDSLHMLDSPPHINELAEQVPTG